MSQPEEKFLIEDIEVFDVLNNPFRQRIMRQLIEPKSVKELAAAMDVPVTRLYHHVNRMSDLGVIEVIDTRKVGAMTEKIYRTSARSYAPGPGLLSAGHDPNDLARIAVGVVLDPARADAEAAMARLFSSDDSTPAPVAIGRGHATMSPDRAREFASKVSELLDEMEQDDSDDDAAEYALTVVFFPSEAAV